MKKINAKDGFMNNYWSKVKTHLKFWGIFELLLLISIVFLVIFLFDVIG